MVPFIRSLGTLAITLLLPAGGGNPQPPFPDSSVRATVEDFAWMEGEWEAITPLGALLEMRVMGPRAGTLAGFMRLTRDGDFWIQESFVIVETEEGLEMRVQPFDKLLAPSQLIVLRLEAWDGTRAVFENPFGDHPKRDVLTLHPDGSWTSRSEILLADGGVQIIENTLKRRVAPQGLR